MHITLQKEQFSRAFIHAIAAVAGVKIQRSDVDDDCVDLELVGPRGTGQQGSPHLAIQAKCTATDSGKSTFVSKQLETRDYDLLRDPNVHVPQILVVLCIPPLVPNWMKHTRAQSAMKRCAYWVSLRGLPPVTTASRAVRVPRAQRFDVPALQGMLQRIETGGLP